MILDYISVPLRYDRNSTICVFSYDDTTKLYASNKNKEVPFENNMLFFTVTGTFCYWWTVPYNNSKNSPVCGLCRSISFTCDMRLCTVNIPQSLTNTNSTLPYRTYGTFWLNIDEIKGMARNRMKKRYRTVNVIKTKIVNMSVSEFSLFYFSQSLHYFSI